MLITENMILVFRDGTPQLIPFPVPKFGTSISEFSQRCGFRLGWARVADDAETLFFYDRLCTGPETITLGSMGAPFSHLLTIIRAR